MHRWEERLENYIRALNRLEKAIKIYNTSAKNEDERLLRQTGLSKSFEFVFELAWKVMKDFEKYEGEENILGSRDAIRKAMNLGIITNEAWMSMINDRNSASHDYDGIMIEDLCERIQDIYFPIFKDFEQKMQSYL